ncbi:CREB/ATF bZIP transcription factor isoform X2 [Conger conger]|uniref:CREB/ATF bZIP transcription factor isoform X2 n=1 Tax=Conger conger TaxID=82655 RepID=UPI002A59C4C4|nr:CREB/ATF bZIP transcription factor isoform X2 [Conger conger]
MITRKRARVGSKPEAKPNVTTWPLEVDTSEEIEVTDDVHTSPFQYSSPESDNTPGLELDLLNIDDFNWQLDKDTIASFFDEGGSGLQDLSTPTSYGSYGGSEALSFSSSPGAVESPRCRSNMPVRINKNAIAARMNRLKKKEYVNGLENKVTSLAAENRNLRQENEHLNKRVEELEDEARYLRAVLANESTLAQLLSRLGGVNGMKVSTSLFQEPNKHDHDYALPRKRVKVEEKDTPGGVCLHVDKNHVSVEFCTKCAESASTALKIFLLGG